MVMMNLRGMNMGWLDCGFHWHHMRRPIFFGPVLIDLYLGEPQPMPPCFSTLIISSLIKTDLSGTKTGYDYEIF